MYPKLTQDEAQFHCIDCRAIQHSTSYMTSGLTSFRQLKRFPETPVLILEEHQFQHSNSRKAPCTLDLLETRADSPASTEEVCQISKSISRGGFHQQYVCEGTLNLLPQVEWTPRCPDSKEGRISPQWLECRLVFHVTR